MNSKVSKLLIALDDLLAQMTDEQIAEVRRFKESIAEHMDFTNEIQLGRVIEHARNTLTDNQAGAR